MLSKSQYTAVWDFLLGRKSKADMVAALGVDPRADREFLPELLAGAMRRHDADGVEAGLGLMISFDQLGPERVPVLCDLLIADWHHKHEDVARYLQELADPAAVPALRRAAELDLPYLEYDENRALSRKCMWALSDIRTDAAVAALESLSHSDNVVVRDLAAYHLAKVRNGEPPSRVSQRFRER
ncbi:HEAT repeat domain-containing protein [Planosporangium thailandense]|uniref:HEAT repeat domain-containing protein n=1 Tax=Planosporangium thailandense TaxID=765197 RepID=A0ABX0Y2Z0_9ACTN|nr:HEAT repeat domain-containing protein [Planosporangium thailandense]NJC71935.1 HEAT repeat domain-containing protein [Planosporangium thailandense]